MFSFASILNAIGQVGSATPAFKAIFDSVIHTFNKPQQDQLKQALADARAKSDDLHGDLQNELREAVDR